MIDIGKTLFLLTKQSRYLGNEWNVVKKNPEKVSLKFAIAFPDLYEIGMSSLGLRILYSLINSIEWASAERVFAPSPDFEDFLRKNEIPLFSLENKIPLYRFDIVGFSLSYEMNYTNVLNILELGKIPLMSSEREDSHPIVIAGGPCTFNPEPLSQFIDLFFIGEAEEGLVEILKTYRELKGERREKIIESLSEIEGVYAPELWKVKRRGRFLVPRFSKARNKIRKRVFEKIDNSVSPSPLVPFCEIVFDRVMVEIARGCLQRCRFCQALTIYSPYRMKSAEKVIEESLNLIESTGYEDISLSSLSVSDYPSIHELLFFIAELFGRDKISISIPSLRPSGLKEKIIEEIKKIRKTGFTIAPEAGTERLRNIINKNITDEEIYRGVELLFSKGWGLIKLYFMLGLPQEMDKDIEGIVEMTKKILEIGRKVSKREIEINLTLSPFVPKPHTPFQWVGMESIESIKEKIKRVKRGLSRYRNINIKAHNPEMSQVEALLSRGDRDLSPLIIKAFREGARLESWKDHFKYNLWEKVLSKEIIEKYLSPLSFDEDLPWDFIDTGFPKETLIKEFNKALNGNKTESCLERNCSQCRDCLLMKRVIYRSFEHSFQANFNYMGERQKERSIYRAYFSKVGNARYLSHLELAKVIERAFRRAKIPVWITEGHHPHMRISFLPPLPIGFSGLQEICEFKSDYLFEEKDFLRAISGKLPEGISFFRLERKEKASLSKDIIGFLYSIDIEAIENNSAQDTRSRSFEAREIMEVLKSIENVENCVLTTEPRKIIFRMKFNPKKGGGSLKELAKTFSSEIFFFMTRERIILKDE
ncbi:MAG: TIGR03960 family B12-binding radical SAM protein [Candidatus Aminicenantia bacterium]